MCGASPPPPRLRLIPASPPLPDLSRYIPEVDIDRGHNAGLELELAELDGAGLWIRTDRNGTRGLDSLKRDRKGRRGKAGDLASVSTSLGMVVADDEERVLPSVTCQAGEVEEVVSPVGTRCRGTDGGRGMGGGGEGGWGRGQAHTEELQHHGLQCGVHDQLVRIV